MDHSFTFDVGVPPGLLAINRRYTRGFRLNASWEAVRDDMVVVFAAAWRQRPNYCGPIQGPVVVSIWETWPETSTIEGDIDSPIKAILDALQHAEVYQNDKHVRELHVYKNDPGKAGMRVRVEW